MADKLRTLFFSEPERKWHFEELRKTSGMSRERVHHYLKQLSKEQFITRTKPKDRMPYYRFNKETFTRLHKNQQYYAKTEWTVEKVKQEINEGLALLNAIDQKIITFFGSHRVNKDSPYYKHCKDVAHSLGKKGYAIASGGGPGIMHAANSGATEANVPSIGLKAELLDKEKVMDPIFTHHYAFHFLFVRRFIMSIKSEALIFYPGGYGTLNELFEYAVLMQTGIVDTVPIICVNKKYWQGLFNWLEENPLKEDFFIHNTDIKLLHFLDDVDEILKLL